MGITISKKSLDFEVMVKTGDVKGAGTDSNVYCVLIDIDGNKSRDLRLDVRWRNDFEKGSIDVFKIRDVPNMNKIDKISLWRDKTGMGDDWFVEFIKVKQYRVKEKGEKISSTESENQINNQTSENENESEISKKQSTNNNDSDNSHVDGTNENKSAEEVNLNNNNISNDEKQRNTSSSSKNQKATAVNIEMPFPCNRWIQPNKKYTMLQFDSVLPQLDERKVERMQEMDEKKTTYVFLNDSANVPKRVENCPKEENFSNDYKWDIIGKKIRFLAQKKFTKLMTSNKWNSFNDLLDVYKGSFGIPYGYYNWQSDEKFGAQRLRGCNPTLLKLCTEIPKNFGVTNEMVEPFLDGLKLDEAIAGKEIFWLNLKILDNLECKNKRVICAPMALFHSKKNGDLMPIAIQLFQEPAEDNPVFLPSDPSYTWLLAKMYFNNADCCLHQTCTHLGFTHLVVESICIAVHRTLSPSHPVFRLLAPHFLYLIAINSLAVEKLLSPDGWIDVTMTMGVCGLYQILERTWKDWRLDVDGWLPNDLKNRGVDDKTNLPSYMYRDDALLIHYAIFDYVSEVLTGVYDTPEKLSEDFEVQAWAETLVDNVYGAGIKGVFGDGKFEKLDDLIKTVSSTIFLSSVGHAAANFCQYDEYAFPPNYPACLNGEVPRNKLPRTEQDIIDQLPNKDTTLSIMVVTKLLSDRGTKPLGDFEIQYQYDPKALEAVQRFRRTLVEISESIKERNRHLDDPYIFLDPEEVPNAISI